MFGIPGMDEIEKQVDKLFAGINAQLAQIEANQKAIAEHFGIDLPEVEHTENG